GAECASSCAQARAFDLVREAAMKILRAMLALSVAAMAFTSLAYAASAAHYKVIDRIKVPDGGFDYATYDAATNRIYMARTDFTTVIDVKSNAVHQLHSG